MSPSHQCYAVRYMRSAPKHRQKRTRKLWDHRRLNGEAIGLGQLSEGRRLQPGSDLRKKFETEDGWKFAYEKRGASRVSFSGTKGDRIMYVRQIAFCDDAMGNFTSEYPAAQKKRFRPLVDRMVKTLKAPKHCD